MPTYLTVADEHIEYADLAYRYLREKNYRVKVEELKFVYPFTPTFVATRSPTTLICEIQGKVDLQRAAGWAQYGRSISKDTRVLLLVPDTLAMSTSDERQLVGLGVGVLVVGATGSYEKLIPKDQAMLNVIPALSAMPRKVAHLLQPAYDRFDRGEWRDGFKKACQTVEASARDHLIADMHSGRINLVKPNGTPSAQTTQKVRRLTAGQLVGAYEQIASPNYADKVIEQGLRHLNSDRVAAIHHENRPQTERALRKNVGVHMTVVMKVLTELAG